MFTRILQWIREVFQKMIGQLSVKQVMKVDIAISSAMAEALQLWSSMYENSAPWLNNDIKSLNLPAAIAGEVARAATIEAEVEITGSARADYLMRQLEPVLDALRELAEKGAAKGGLMLKPYVAGKKIFVDYVQADMFYPVKFDANGKITACIFADQRQEGNRFFTRLENHEMTDTGCVIRNMAFKSTSRDALGQQVALDAVEDWAGLEPEATITGIEQPLFAYFRYPLANNIDPTSPLGVSCFSRATDLIRQADELWSNLLWEFESGKRAIYVDVLAFGKDADGLSRLPDKRLYRTLDAGGQKDDFFQAWSPDFREAALKSGLNTIFQRIEFNCGLAYGTLSDPANIEKTATEIASSKQRSMATIVDTQKAMETMLDDLVYAMDTWATLANLTPRGTYDVTYSWDDSLIVDHDSQLQTDRQAVSMQIMSKWRYLMRNYGLSEEEAKKWVIEAQDEQPEEDNLFQGA